MSEQQILKNTLYLYVRQVLIVFLNLFALRIVLNTLGVRDYGIFTVVAGFVTLLSFLPGTMASATQRFFSFSLGQNDQDRLNKTFSANWLLYALISLVILLVLETAGFWYISEQLIIPAGRVIAAKTLYHYIVFSFVLSVFSSPFMAILIAHEDMHMYAFISIVESALKFFSTVVLIFMPWDSLSLYGQLLFFVALLNVLLYALVCLNKYEECQFRKFFWDAALVKEILGFTGWTMFGQLSTVMRFQAVTVLLNQFFNPATVAARAIAGTVANQVMVFSHNFNTGLYPSIIKTYAEGQKKEMLGLVLNGSKLTFYLMWVFALPLMVEMGTVLQLWLKTPPDKAVLFTRLAIVEALILSLSLPIATAARAPGKMKVYELTLGTIQLMMFFCCWFLVSAGYPAKSVFIAAIVANVVMFKARLLIVSKLVGLPVGLYYRRVLLPVAAIVLASALPIVMISLWGPHSIIFSLFIVVSSVALSTVCMYYIGLDSSWRKKSKDMILNCLTKFRFGL